MDKDTFAAEVLANEQMLYRISKSILFYDSDCGDAVQEAIFKAYSKISQLREEKYFTSWLVRILINECYRINSSKRRETSFEEYMQSEEAEEKSFSELYEAIMRLPEKQRLAVELYYIEGYSVEETGKILGIPSGTVKSRLSEGRKKLKAILEE